MAEALVPNYFFMNNSIYKKIRVVRSEDYLVAWSYKDEMRMRFSYSNTRRNATKAYKLPEVAKLIGRSTVDVYSYVERGLAPRPSGPTYHIGSKKPHTSFWSQDDILYLRDRIYELAPKNKYGEPYVSFKLISKAELLAQLVGDTSYYVQDSDGSLHQVWKAI